MIVSSRSPKVTIGHQRSPKVTKGHSFSDLHVPGDVPELLGDGVPGGDCIKIGLPGKLITGKRKGLREVRFS